MTLKRMDNVGIVFADLKAAIAFFTDLGFVMEGETQVGGDWVDKVVGLDEVRCDIAVMRTPDGHNRIELMQFLNPQAITPEPRNAPPNTLGIRRIMFAVDNVDEVVARLQKKHGAELMGEVTNFKDLYRLCYMRGPEGIIIALAQELGVVNKQELFDGPTST